MPNRLAAATAAAVGLVAILCAGCSRDPDITAKPGERTTSAPATTSATKPASSDVESATRVRDVATIAATWPGDDPDGRSYWALAMTSEEVLLGRGSRSGDVNGMVIRPIDGSRPDVAVPSGSGEGAVAGDLDESTVVWTESGSADLGVDPWVLYAYDRKSEKVSELARAELIDGNLEPPPAPGFTGPILLGAHVYWPQVGGTMGAEVVDIYRCEVRNCRPERIVEGAAFPAPTADGVFYVAGSRYAGDRKGFDFSIGRLDLATGKQTTVRELEFAPGQAPSGFDADAGRAIVTASVGDHGWAEIVDTKSGDVLHRIESAPNGSFTFPNITNRLAVWAEGNSGAETTVGGYLIDFDTGRLHSVGNTAGFYANEASGDSVIWQDTRPFDDGEDGLAVDLIVGSLT